MAAVALVFAFLLVMRAVESAPAPVDTSAEMAKMEHERDAAIAASLVGSWDYTWVWANGNTGSTGQKIFKADGTVTGVDPAGTWTLTGAHLSVVQGNAVLDGTVSGSTITGNWRLSNNATSSGTFTMTRHAS